MAIKKSEGVTPTERLLADICEKSFLKLWSYPNPLKEDGDEFCDLLAVFENHVFIFFDRENRQLDDPERDPQVSWLRWKRKTIDAQIRTAHGAERYLRKGRPVYLDQKLTVPFPISIDPSTMIVHKIIVAHGAKEACENSSDENICGSLAIFYGESSSDLPFPFAIDIDRENPVHIFDSHNLPIIFSELDTVSDLSEYLDAKIEAIQKLNALIYCGEEDLLAHYFANFDEQTKRHFIGVKDETINFVLIGEGEWKSFIEMDAYKRKKSADKQSYLWDEIIQRTAQNALDGTLLGNASFLQGESAIHEMAKEPRFSRRALSEEMARSIRNFPETSKPIVRSVSLMPSFHEGTAYVFLQLKVDGIGDYDGDYRPKRQALLEIACGAAKNRQSELTRVVGIAIDAPKFAGSRNSEDFILMRCQEWSVERRKRYEQANEGPRFFATNALVEERRTVKAFPDAPSTKMEGKLSGKVGRNDSCPCGSGLKYKRCCLSKWP